MPKRCLQLPARQQPVRPARRRAAPRVRARGRRRRAHRRRDKARRGARHRAPSVRAGGRRAHRPQAATGARRGSRRSCRSCATGCESGVSISYCTSAVEATVEPLTGSCRRSTTTTREPGLRQRIGDHRAGDAGADDQHIGVDDLLRALRGVPWPRGVLPRPNVRCADCVFGDHAAPCLRKQGLTRKVRDWFSVFAVTRLQEGADLVDARTHRRDPAHQVDAGMDGARPEPVFEVGAGRLQLFYQPFGIVAQRIEFGGRDVQRRQAVADRPRSGAASGLVRSALFAR